MFLLWIVRNKSTSAALRRRYNLVEEQWLTIYNFYECSIVWFIIVLYLH